MEQTSNYRKLFNAKGIKCLGRYNTREIGYNAVVLEREKCIAIVHSHKSSNLLVRQLTKELREISPQTTIKVKFSEFSVEKCRFILISKECSTDLKRLQGIQVDGYLII